MNGAGEKTDYPPICSRDSDPIRGECSTPGRFFRNRRQDITFSRSAGQCEMSVDRHSALATLIRRKSERRVSDREHRTAMGDSEKVQMIRSDDHRYGDRVGLSERDAEAGRVWICRNHLSWSESHGVNVAADRRAAGNLTV